MATIVDVTILGNRYKLKSSDNEARQLEELAAWLDARMQETASHLKRVNPLNVSILTALQLAEELFKGQAEAKAACGRLQKQYNSELAKLTKQQAGELARLTKQYDGELARCKGEMAAFKSQYGGELAALKKQHDEELTALKRQDRKSVV